MNPSDTPPSDAAEAPGPADPTSRTPPVPAGEYLGSLSPDAMSQLFEELRSRQADLEASHEDIRRMQGELDAARARFADVYDQFPVGLCTLDANGLVVEANSTVAALLGVDRGFLIGKPLADFVVADDRSLCLRHLEQALEAGSPPVAEMRMARTDAKIVWVRVETASALDAHGGRLHRVVLSDITEHRLRDDAHEMAARLIVLLNAPGDFRERMSELTTSLQAWSRCEAVGIRFRDGDDFPYFETRGFPAAFVRMERSLCAYDEDGEVLRDSCGNPVLECMCGTILCGRTDPSKPFFTTFGSFCSNNTTALLASTTEADRQVRTRNRCNGEGYESVALIPLRSGTQVFGLLQFNDHRTNRFTPNLIASLEGMADTLAVALSRRQAEEALSKSEAGLRHAQAVAHMGSWTWHTTNNRLEWSDEMYRLFGIEKSCFTGDLADVIARAIHPDDRARVDQANLVVVQSGTPEPTEYRVVWPDGSVHHIRAEGGKPVLDEEGTVVALSGYAQDITDRVLSEAELSRARQELETFFNLVPDMVAVASADGRLLHVNPEWERTLGYKAQELVGSSVFSFLHPDDIASTNAEVERQLRGLSTLHFENRYRHKDGSYRWLEWRATPSVGGRLYAAARDITERQRTDEALRQSEARMGQAQRLARLGVWEWDVATDTTVWSDEMLAIYGITAEEFTGRGLDYLAFTHPDDRSVQLGNIRRDFELAGARRRETGDLVDTGPDPKEFRIIRKDGSTRYVRGDAIEVVDASGKPIRMYGILSDVTEQKYAEQAFRENEERHRAIIQSAIDGFLQLDEDGRLLEVNETYQRMSGYSADELLEMRIADLEASETAAEVAARISALKTQGEGRFESRHRRKDGSVFDVEVSVQYRPEEGGRIVAFLHDITARKQAAEERARLQGQLQQAQKMESVGRLAGGVAHDFNNMLGVILGHAEIALELTDPDQPIRLDLEEIRRAAARSVDLTRQLLAFARKQTVAPRVLDLNQSVEGMLKMLQRLIGEEIDLAWRPAADLWPVKVDPSQLDQVLANLCVNARDAIAGPGRITIVTGAGRFGEADCARLPGFVPGEYVRLMVSDDGCGMDQDTLAHIFEPFFTTKGVGTGTGLGLATVYGVVTQNGGFIDVVSAPGSGTTFTVYLPRYQGKVIQGDAQNETGPLLRGHETILVVEDEAAILRLTSAILKKQGYTVLSAGTPGEAIQMAREHPGDIHLLVTDVVMPEMNGRSLAKNLLALYPRIQRLFMSGYTADVIAHQGVLDEGVHFLQKPFTREHLAAKVREALDGERQPVS
jgi:two-component system cell cycle sensor histidine kinase/response regulator CckA